MNTLDKGLEQLKLDLSGFQRDKLNAYIGELEQWNPLYSLVNATGEELIIRHILDSLSAVPLLGKMPGATLADMGSGGGLPGIPLAICFPDREVHLVERSGKRCDFLGNAKIMIGLNNVTVLNRDLKDVAAAYRLITFRAFRPFEPEIVKGLKKALAPGGIIAAYKGKRKKTEEEMNALSPHFSRMEIHGLSVPFLQDEERHLLILEN